MYYRLFKIMQQPHLILFSKDARTCNMDAMATTAPKLPPVFSWVTADGLALWLALMSSQYYHASIDGAQRAIGDGIVSSPNPS
ncbi:uncharacterized protein SETTUDRAFT_157135 [Exserohilum turcica Et28A]|uniref:Uncharacterized protein n=1 Tax=Exserohilum turcicum (strain 28A) TaxID=671987 RepID=R0JXT7_EXST2|nr:uncharacterized protein SETTUDRAFT_157135 [Exserohilum turcica Et28A]EOA82309.1 hypothetical protein SETTUDRAFT_157135 [Exserohilum turcica Et28A]